MRDVLMESREQLRFITGKIDESWRPVMVEDISFIESSQKKTWFYSGGDSFCTAHTLKELNPRLPDYFLQVHRSYIVNIYFIEEISRDLVSAYSLTLKDGSILPVSQSFAASVRNKLEF